MGGVLVPWLPPSKCGRYFVRGRFGTNHILVDVLFRASTLLFTEESEKKFISPVVVPRQGSPVFEIAELEEWKSYGRQVRFDIALYTVLQQKLPA